MLTWNQAMALPIGTRVRFTDSYDVFPLCVVPQGTRATVIEIEHAEKIISVLPDNRDIRESLMEWHGEIKLAWFNDGMEGNDESPLAAI